MILTATEIQRRETEYLKRTERWTTRCIDKLFNKAKLRILTERGPICSFVEPFRIELSGELSGDSENQAPIQG